MSVNESLIYTTTVRDKAGNEACPIKLRGLFAEESQEINLPSNFFRKNKCGVRKNIC